MDLGKIMKSIFTSLAIVALTALFAHAQVAGTVNEDGIIVISGNGEEAAGVDINSAGGHLVPVDGGAAPFAFFLSNTANQITWGNLGTAVTLEGEWVTGAGYTGDDPAGDITATWGSGVTPVAFPVTGGTPVEPPSEVIPEPATGILAAFAFRILMLENQAS